MIVSQGRVLFRASTIDINAGKPVALTFDRKLNDCSSQYVTMNFQLASGPALRNYKSRNYFGQMRVDTYRVHSITYRVQKDRGSRFGYIQLTNFDSDRSIVRELRYGRVVRFRLKTDTNEYFFSFTLPGYRAASARAKSMCKNYHRDSNKQYFERTNDRPSSDRDYFL